MRKSTQQLVARHYPQIATDLLSPLVDLLNLARRHTDGDLDKLLVVLVVALRTTKHREFAERTPEELISAETLVLPGLGTNGRSISESLSIPKETVRRKVAELVTSGWIARSNGKLYLTAQAYRELGPVREQMEFLAVRYHEVIEFLRRRVG